MKKHIPIRMCIVCKERLEQYKMHRFQIKSCRIITKVKMGRSLYICNLCLQKDEKNLQKAFSKVSKGIIEPNLKEMFVNDKG